MGILDSVLYLSASGIDTDYATCADIALAMFLTGGQRAVNTVKSLRGQKQQLKICKDESGTGEIHKNGQNHVSTLPGFYILMGVVVFCMLTILIIVQLY